jgi:hypothetical protein
MIHHEGTKDTKDTKHNNKNLLLAPCLMTSVSRSPFVSFVPSW